MGRATKADNRDAKYSMQIAHLISRIAEYYRFITYFDFYQ